MALFLFYNDAWLAAEQPLVAAGNRGFRYGDGLFETLYVAGGTIRLQDYHFERLFAGLQLLQLQLPEKYDAAYLAAQVATLCKKNQHTTARVRLTVFRGDGNLFDPPGATAHCIIESQALAPGSRPATNGSRLPAPAAGLSTGIFPHARKSADAFSHLKSNNYLSSAMAAIHARQRGWDDAFLLNAEGRICESAIANVFIARGGRLYTPPLSEGCVAGVMRRFLLSHLAAAGYAVEEAPVSVADLYAAEEVFLTNALRLLSPVSRCDEAQYSTRFGTGILHALSNVIM
jgi:branched-chain amino acid aminotransferase